LVLLSFQFSLSFIFLSSNHYNENYSKQKHFKKSAMSRPAYSSCQNTNWWIILGNNTQFDLRTPHSVLFGSLSEPHSNMEGGVVVHVQRAIRLHHNTVVSLVACVLTSAQVLHDV